MNFEEDSSKSNIWKRLLCREAADGPERGDGRKTPALRSSGRFQLEVTSRCSLGYVRFRHNTTFFSVTVCGCSCL